MKALFFLFTISSILLGQSDSTPTQSYFPLHVGNEWCYLRSITTYEGTKETLIKQTIICDTLMPNGEKYFGMENDSTYEISYYRNDYPNEKVFIYDHNARNLELLCYDFNSDQTTYNSHLFGPINVTLGIDSINNLMLYEPFIEFSYRSNYGGNIKSRFSNEIGITWYSYTGLGESIVDKLVFAKINGKVFGQPTKIQETPNSDHSKEYIVNFPNPFNSQTTLLYNISTSGNVIIRIYNSLGELVKELGPFYRNDGQYEQKLNMGNYNSGIYFCQLYFNNRIFTKKILYIK